VALGRAVSYKGLDPRKVYEKWHWGEKSHRVIEPKDRSLPPQLIEIGALMELHVSPRDGDPYILEVPSSDRKNNHVAFDMDHHYQRIYVVLSDTSIRDAAALFDPRSPAYKLVEVARAAGGRHGRMKDYPNVDVQPLGVLTNTVYFTNKKGDGRSGYIHEMGEEGGTPPILAVSKDGRLWYAGGSYTCPIPGITN
jgi:hypothetical protein